MLRLFWFLLGILALISVIAYAFFGASWWTPTLPNDMSSRDGQGRGMLIFLLHFVALVGLSPLGDRR